MATLVEVANEAGGEQGATRSRATVDRRRVLRAVGVGAAVGWAAPSVISVSAAAAATPPVPPVPPIPLTLDWGAQFPNPYPSSPPDPVVLPVAFTTPASTTIGGRVTVTFAHSDPDAIGTVISDVYRNFIVYRGDRTATFSNPPLIGGTVDPYFLLQVDADGFGSEVSTTWTFSEPVSGLTFRIDGIDQGSFSSPIGPFVYTDVVSVTGRLGAAVVVPTLTPVPVAPTPAAFSVAAAVATGTAFAGNGSTGGNCFVTFPAAVTSITITYRPGQAGSGWQFIGVRDLDFTVPGP